MASYSKFVLLSFTRATSYRGVSCRPVSVTTRASVCVHVCQTVTTRCFIETDGRLELEKKTEVSFDMSYATITGNTGKVKVKFSHTRYRALGPELIPVYRQSARR